MKQMIIATLFAMTVNAAPALAIIDDGSGCGCIRPCITGQR
jgi:hypothetical protein